MESIGRKYELNIHRWRENNATYYLEPGCAILHYFYFHHLKLLFDVLLVLVRKYGRKQVSRICDQLVVNFEPWQVHF